VNNLGWGRARGFAVVSLAALLGLVLLLAVIAYFPFDWDPPRTVSNEVTRSADGSLRFGDMNAARTPGTPAWLQELRSSGIVHIRLVAEPRSPEKHSPSSIMMLASDYWHTDFAIAQDHGDLVVWLRRPGSTDAGEPPFVVGGVFRPHRRTSVDVILRRADIRIAVDGTTRLTGHLPADSARVWGAGQIALGDEVLGGGPWQGEIRHAEVRTPGHAVDYVRPGALSIPERYFYLPDHVAPFPPPSLNEWLILLLHLLSFIPLGFLIAWARRPPVRPVPATALAVGLAVVLAAGKFLFYARHMAVADIVLESVGALLGALLAARLARHLPGAARAAEMPGH
jgi:VanZ family protein